MKKILELVKNEIICVYKDKRNTETFFLGYILGFDDSFLLLESIDTYGFVDDICIIKIEDIYLIEVNNKYIEDIIKQGPKKINVNLDNSNNVFQNYLKYIINEKKMVDIETNGSEKVNLHGIVLDVIDDCIELEAYENEIKDGKAYCRIENISMIGFK